MLVQDNPYYVGEWFRRRVKPAVHGEIGARHQNRCDNHNSAGMVIAYADSTDILEGGKAYMKHNIQSMVVKALAEASDAEIAPESVTMEMTLRDDLQLDSLGALTLVMDMEDEFGISVAEEEIVKFETVRDVVAAIESRLPQEIKVG